MVTSRANFSHLSPYVMPSLTYTVTGTQICPELKCHTYHFKLDTFATFMTIIGVVY